MVTVVAPGMSNEGGSSPLLVLLPAVSWPWVPAWGPLKPSRRDGENAQTTRKNGEEMAEIQPKKCEGRELTKDQLGEREREGIVRTLIQPTFRRAAPPLFLVAGINRSPRLMLPSGFLASSRRRKQRTNGEQMKQMGEKWPSEKSGHSDTRLAWGLRHAGMRRQG